MPTLHASPDWAHPSTTTTRPGPVTVTAVTPAPTTPTEVVGGRAGPLADAPVSAVPADAADVVLLPATVETAPPPPTLPHTGAHTADLATAAVCLIFAGVLAVLTARRINHTGSRNR